MISSSVNPAKFKYKVPDWQAYNKSLCNRGKFTLFFTPRMIRIWRNVKAKQVTVGEKIYPDEVIELCLTLGKMYHLSLRRITGFVEDLLELAGLSDLPIPNFSTLCRRQKSIKVVVLEQLDVTKKYNIAVDSTGLKVFGEGEWKTRKHGYSKRRTWIKLHLAVDVNTQFILNTYVTNNAVDDAQGAINMFSNPKDKEYIGSFYGDGAYDNFKLREHLSVTTKQIIPPPKRAVIKQPTGKKPLPNYLVQRNEHVKRRKEIGSKPWKEEIGYHKRSLSETAMYRYKVTFGDKVEARTEKNQETEILIKCKILNRFTQEGIANSYRV